MTNQEKEKILEKFADNFKSIDINDSFELEKYCNCNYPRPHTYASGTKTICTNCGNWIQLLKG